MNFRIADTFTDSLVKLTGDEQKAGKTITFDLQLKPGSSGFFDGQRQDGMIVANAVCIGGCNR